MKTRALILGIAFTLPLVAKADWPQYHGPNLNNTTDETIAVTDWKSGMKEVWKTDAHLGFSSFTIADGSAFTLVSREIEGNPMEVCIALDAATGEELWAAPLWIPKYGGGGNSGAKGNDGGDGPRSTPTYADGHLYVIDANVRLYCFNAKTGDVVWKHDVLKEFGGENIKWANAASPVVDGGMVYMAGGGRGRALLAFDAKDGKVVWKGENDKMTHATPIVTDLHGVRQVIFFTQEGLVAMEAKEGDELWRYDFPFKVSTAASPVVYEDIVFCSAGYGVGGGAVRVSKKGSKFEAEEIWRTEGDNVNHWSTSIVKDGYLYGMFSFKEYGDGPLACVDIRTGEMKWSEKGFGPGNVILVGDQLLVLGDAGQLVLVETDPKKYSEVARAEVLEGKCWSTPVISNGRIYARSTAQAVCLDVSGKVAAK